MKINITGHSGFVGRNLIPYLVKLICFKVYQVNVVEFDLSNEDFVYFERGKNICF